MPLKVRLPTNAARPLSPATSVLIAIRPAAVEAGERLVEAGCRRRTAAATIANRLAGQSKRVERRAARRPAAGARLDRDRDIGAQVRRSGSAPGTSRGLDGRQPALEPAGQIAAALRARRRAARTASPARCVLSATSSDEVGQAERLVARRRQQFVDLAPADPAADQPAAQPDAARDDRDRPRRCRST